MMGSSKNTSHPWLPPSFSSSSRNLRHVLSFTDRVRKVYHLQGVTVADRYLETFVEGKIRKTLYGKQPAAVSPPISSLAVGLLKAWK